MPGTGRLLTITLASFALTAIAGIAPADAKKPKNIKDITLSPIVTFDSGSGEGGAEIVAFDSVNDLVLVTNGEENRIDIFPLPAGAPSSFDLTPFGAGVQSVAVKNGLAVAVVAADPVVLPGSAVFFDPANPGAGASAVVQVGALPDMVTFNYQGGLHLV